MKSLRHVTVPLARHGGEQELFAYSAYFFEPFRVHLPPLEYCWV